jgi:hypothetical protein
MPRGCKLPSVRFEPLGKVGGWSTAKLTAAAAVPRFFPFAPFVKIGSVPRACLVPSSSRDADSTFLNGEAVSRCGDMRSTISLGKLARRTTKVPQADDSSARRLRVTGRISVGLELLPRNFTGKPSSKVEFA